MFHLQHTKHLHLSHAHEAGVEHARKENKIILFLSFNLRRWGGAEVRESQGEERTLSRMLQVISED